MTISQFQIFLPIKELKDYSAMLTVSQVYLSLQHMAPTV